MDAFFAAEALIPAEPPAARPDRVRRLGELLRRPASHHPVPWRGGYLKVPAVSAAQDLLVYRVENGRLIAELDELAHAGGETLEQLGARQDSLQVQRLLHGLLVAKAADAQGPILQELQRLEQQTEPLLVTADGVVVNGNRRLAAMRELMARDARRFAAFASVMVAVLPSDASPEDLEAVEAALQMAPETKLAYGWINRRLKLRRQRQQPGLGDEAVVEASRLDGAAQLERELAELALVEDYLQSYAHAPGRYSLAADAQALFTGLAQQLPRLEPPLAGAWRLAAFALIHGRHLAHGPMDRVFPFAEPLPQAAPELALLRLAEERRLMTSAGQALGPEVLARLNELLADPAQATETAPALLHILERLRTEHLEQHTPARMLSLAAKLAEAMASLRSDQLDERQRRILGGHLAAVQAQTRTLLGDAPPRPRPRGLTGRLRRLLQGE